MISPQYVDGLELRIKELEQWQRDMVKKAAEKSLDGYRELGQRAAKAEAERDALAAHVERCYRAGYQDGYAERENGHEYQPQEAWKHCEEREILPTTSLARLARLKAEALTDFAKWAQNDLTLDGLFINFDELIKRYRRQAEEAS